MDRIWQLMELFDKCTFSHTLWEGNKLADLLANLGCDGEQICSLNPDELCQQYPKVMEVASCMYMAGYSEIVFEQESRVFLLVLSLRSS